MKKCKVLYYCVFVILLLSLFVFCCSAAGNPVTLKEFFGYKNGVVACAWLIDDSYIACNYFYRDDNTLVFTDPVDGNPWPDNPEKNGVDANVTWSGSYPISRGDVLSFNCRSLYYYLLNDVSSGTFELTCSFKFKDFVGQIHEVECFSGGPSNIWEDSQTVRFSFDYDYNIPSNYVELVGVSFDFTMFDNNFQAYRVDMNAVGWEWYLGPPQYSPSFGEADTSYLDDLKAQEDELKSKTSSGIDGADSLLGSLLQVIGPATSTGEGLLAVTALLTPVFQPFQSVLLVSLAIGLIMFILGIVSWLGSSARSSKRDKSSKGG